MRQRLGPNATGREGAAEPADLRLVPSAVAAWLGTLAGLHASPGAQKGLAIAAAVLALLAIAGIRSGPGRLAVGMALAAALAGLAGGAARAAAVHEGPVAELSAARAQVSVAAVVTSDPSLRAGEESESGEPYVVARLRVERIVGRGVTTEVRTPVVLVASDPGWASVLPGTPVSLSGRLAPADGGPVAAFLRSGEPPRPTGRPGITSRLTEPFREGLRVAVGGLPPAAQGIVPGMAVGDESRLPPDLRRAMQETGLTHLTAVSGVHVSVVLIAVLGLARWAGVRGYGLPVVAVVSIVGFAALVRPEPSVVRASTMGLIGIVGLTAAGRKRALPALAAAVLALLLLDPWLAVSIGFALSVLSTAGILLLAPVWRDALPWVPRPAAEAIAVPMSAQAASLPVLVAFVSETSLAALPANVLVAPAVAPATLLGVLAAAVSPVFPTAAAAAAWLAGWPARWIAVVAERGASLPGAVVRWPEGAAGVVAASVLVLLLIVALPRLLRRRPLSVAAAAMALALLVGAPSPGWPPRGWLVVACPVGQGDAFVIHAGPASAVVVDAGPDPDRVDRCLDELGVTHVHLLVLTHFHADHVEGLPGVLQGRRVDEVMVSPLAEPAELAASVASWLAGANVPTTIAAAGERRLTGSVELRVIWPVRIIGRGEPAANDASVVVQAAVGGIDVLMTGDVEPLAQRAIERAEPDLRADVLKVPHHGSRFQEPDWLVRVGAEVALIGVGEGNRHGHPAADTVRTLEQAGAAVYRTDQDGAIAVVRTPDGRLGVTTRGAGVFAQRRRADVVRLSGRRDILGRMPPKDVPVTLAVGPEALLAERAVAAVARKARAADPDADLTEVAGGQLSTPALNEHLSPSLFTTRRVVVVHDVQDVPEATGEALVGFCRAPIEDVSLVLLHPGGVKGKRLLDSLRRAGAREVACDRLTRADEQVEFVRSEVAVHGGRIEQAAARALVEAIGGDLRGLASAAAQLAADADGGVISSGAVATYFEGRAEVKGWVVADRAVEGRTADALEQLRWALETGTDPVLVTAALATALRSLARLSGAPRGVRDADIARDLGVPPWKVRMLRSQLRGWTPGGLMRAIRAVAEADLQVKGAGNDPTLALTTAIVEVGVARAA